jgi:5-methylcytosine-specific restriction endonuclease McrA
MKEVYGPHPTQQQWTSSGATIDHVIPKSKGGDDSMDNLVLACTACNGAKGNRTTYGL